MREVVEDKISVLHHGLLAQSPLDRLQVPEVAHNVGTTLEIQLLCGFPNNFLPTSINLPNLVNFPLLVDDLSPFKYKF